MRLCISTGSPEPSSLDNSILPKIVCVGSNTISVNMVNAGPNSPAMTYPCEWGVTSVVVFAIAGTVLNLNK